MDNHKSLIDNWSLELAGALLDNESDFSAYSNEDFINCLGGLSNYINALLFYDETNFLANGFENDWKRFDWFKKNAQIFINPINPVSLNIDWNSNESYSDKGIKNYLVSAKQFELDLFVSPQRSNEISNLSVPKIETSFDSLLKNIDAGVSKEKNSSWFDDVRVGIDRNFLFPSLTHYVFSQVTSYDDLHRVIIEIKDSKKIQSVRQKINEITTNTKNAGKFQKEVEKIINESFGGQSKSDKPWSIKLSVLFLTLTKAFNLDFFNRKTHLLFLKDLIRCRTEAFRLSKDIERIFKRKIF